MTDYSVDTGSSKCSKCLVLGGVLFLFLVNEVHAQSGGQMAVEDIRDIMVKRPSTSVFPVILSIVVLLGALMIGVSAIKRILTRQPEMGSVPPELIARSRLQQIGLEMENEPPNKVSLEISEAVKDFLRAQYQDPIRFETAEEYLRRISLPTMSDSIKFSDLLTEEVRSFMNISQELKFAQIREARNQLPALVNHATKIIEMAIHEKAKGKRLD